MNVDFPLTGTAHDQTAGADCTTPGAFNLHLGLAGIARISLIQPRLTSDHQLELRLMNEQPTDCPQLTSEIPPTCGGLQAPRPFRENVLTSESAEWKRHRKITAPAFSEVRDYQPKLIIPCVE